MGIPLIDGGMKTTKMPVYVSTLYLGSWTVGEDGLGIFGSQVKKSFILFHD